MFARPMQIELTVSVLDLDSYMPCVRNHPAGSAALVAADGASPDAGPWRTARTSIKLMLYLSERYQCDQGRCASDWTAEQLQAALRSNRSSHRGHNVGGA